MRLFSKKHVLVTRGPERRQHKETVYPDDIALIFGKSTDFDKLKKSKKIKKFFVKKSKRRKIFVGAKPKNKPLPPVVGTLSRYEKAANGRLRKQKEESIYKDRRLNTDRREKENK